MSTELSKTSEFEYIRAEDRIVQVANDKDNINWKSFLYDIIYSEGLNPWDIDLGILTKNYLSAIKDMKNIDFESSGKFITIAVFLLKTKADNLVEKDLRGIDEKIAWAQKSENDDVDFDSLEELDSHLDELNELDQIKKKDKYAIKIRNPIARKRKVNIFDLIKVLEKTFEQSNKRRANFFARNPNTKYKGPIYEKKPMDLKQIMNELFDLICRELKNKKGHINFSNLHKGINHKMGILEKFIPLLYLHNHKRVYLKQDSHLGEIEVHNENPNPINLEENGGDN